MRRRERPQLRFVVRASVLLFAMLALWWLALRPPLLAWVRWSSTVLLQAKPGLEAPAGVTAGPGGVWDLAVPAPGSPSRVIRIHAPVYVPTLYSVSIPIYCAIWFAAPWYRRFGRAFAAGAAVLLLVQPFSLVGYAVHVIQMQLYPHGRPLAVWAIKFTDYLTLTVLPYVLPVLLALLLHRGLRALVFGGEEAEAIPAGPAARKPSKSRGR